MERRFQWMVHALRPEAGERIRALHQKDFWMTFDPTKPVQTRDGREAEIAWTDMTGTYPILGRFRNDDGTCFFGSWQSNGLWSMDGNSSFDLINIPQTKKVWVNVYMTENGYADVLPFKTEDDAKDYIWQQELGHYKVKFVAIAVEIELEEVE